MNIFGIAMQSAVLKFAPYAADAAVSIYSGIFNVGIGGGAFIGSIILTRYSAAALNPFACLIALPALLIFSAAVLLFGFNRDP
jgi:DHA1 family L-arabinose/isopropyl-beta-D-thiogalactopyranoside export protein-like MFS transporter